MSNVHERTWIGWIERKIKFQTFIFRVMVIFRDFCFKNCQLSMNFHDNSRNRNHKSPKIVFSFDSAHYASSKKVGSKLRGGVCISFIGTEPKYFFSIRFRRFFFLRKTFFWKNVRIFFEIFLVKIYIFFNSFMGGELFFSWKKNLS